MEQREQDIQRLLVVMNQALEDAGYQIGYPFFDFLDAENEIIKKLGWEFEYFSTILKICHKRRYVNMSIGCSGGFHQVSLTELGEYQALHGNDHKEYGNTNIEHITIHGIQIGNGNIQNFSNFISIIEAKINEASVSEDEKKEAKNLLLKLTENPLVSSIIGGLISGLV